MKWIFFMLFFLLSFIAFGADVVTAPEGFEWIGTVIVFLQSIPAVGKVLGYVFGVIACLSAIATFLSVAVQAVCKLLEGTFNVVGASKFGEKIAKFTDKILPWLKYLSIFNVQKKK